MFIGFVRLVWAAFFGLAACRTTHPGASLSATGKVEITEEQSRLQVALVKYDRTKCPGDTAFVSRCTGTRIDQTTVLMAAHCVLKGGKITEVFKVEDFEALNRIMPERLTDCLDTARITEQLTAIGGVQPTKVFVVKPSAEELAQFKTEKDVPLAFGPDLALANFTNLKTAIVPFAGERPPTGSMIHKFGFGTVDCLRTVGEGEYRFQQGGKKYGFARVDSRLLDAASAKAYDPSIAADPKRRFTKDLLSVSGAGGAYSCVGDSGAGALIYADGRWQLAGVHTGGTGMLDPKTGEKGKFKLETAISIHHQEFCEFLDNVGRADLKALFPVGSSGCGK